jgi:hypothetical protein
MHHCNVPLAVGQARRAHSDLMRQNAEHRARSFVSHVWPSFHAEAMLRAKDSAARGSNPIVKKTRISTDEEQAPRW